MLGVEKKSVLQLQDPRTVRKVVMLDDHICLAFAGECNKGHWRYCMLIIGCISSGLTADGRVLIDKARIECQSHRLTVEDPVTVEYITRHVAGIQQVKASQCHRCTNLCFYVAIYPIGRSTALRYFHPYHRL